jgi:hypothetical protein
MSVISWPVAHTRFNESHQADIEGVSVTRLCTSDFAGRLCLLVCHAAMLNKTSFELMFRSLLILSLGCRCRTLFLFLDSDLVIYITSRVSSHLYLDGKENITDERFA